MIRWSHLFSGLGKIKRYAQAPLLNSNITPVSQPIRRLPLSLWDEVIKEINRLEEHDII